MKIGIIGIFTLLSLQALGQQLGNLLGTWSDNTLVSSTAHNNAYNEIWGLAVNNKEYAIIGSTLGTHFIDVTDPNDPVASFIIVGEATGTQIVHRDYHDHKGYLFIVADEGAASTLQIVDITTLPLEPEVVYNNQFLINRAHNIFIDESTDRLYALSARTSSGFAPFAVYDISDPIDPKEIHRGSNIAGFSFSHVHDAYVKDHIGYFNCGTDGLVIADMTDLSNIQLIHSLSASEYPQSGYNHSGWPSEDGTTYYFADENHGRDMKILDVSSGSSTSILGTLTSNVDDTFSIPHNQIVHGDLLFTAYYYDGLQVYNIEDPTNVSLVMSYPTSNIDPRDRYEGAWGVYPFLPSGNILVSDMQEGLFVIEKPIVSSTHNIISDNQLSIFPNPTPGYILIKNDTEFRIESWTLTNALGQELWREDLSIPKGQQAEHYLKEADGTFFLEITFENNVQKVRSIVISKK